MSSIALYVAIYLAVLLSIYQVYYIYYEQHFADFEKRPGLDEEGLAELSGLARQVREGGDRTAFEAAVRSRLGDRLDPRVVLAAFAREGEPVNAAQLLRRRRQIVTNGSIMVRHLARWKTTPPARDIRGLMILVITVLCLSVLALGGLAIYTVGYQLASPSLAWANEPAVLLALIAGLIVATHLVYKLDVYLHDLYQIGRLNLHFQ
ncbi:MULTISPECIES: hypothetical protein [Halomonas]|uniref:hypothetical protein n=1 Tax=Halomonas TaxID=2745 RepID=UPI001A903EAD|nr:MULTISPECIES: hypothetical protein [Halomonas]MBN8413271.1 hypothetical protein [Halomonas litopenaei]MBY5928325.1 hypothetical protein [Halomonas sp. DP8Y7-3]